MESLAKKARDTKCIFTIEMGCGYGNGSRMMKYAEAVVETPVGTEKQKPVLEKLPSSYQPTSEKEHSECGAKEAQDHLQNGDSTTRAAQCGEGELRISSAHFIQERKDSITDSYELQDRIGEGMAVLTGQGPLEWCTRPCTSCPETCAR